MNLIGNGWAVKKLRSAMECDALAQSHLLVGPASVGKATLARELAAELLSRGSPDPARARRLALQNKHPDLSWVEQQAEKSKISIEQIRELMQALSRAPGEGAWRMGVINDAHLLSVEGQNAILKTLEEPSPAVVLALITPNQDSLLPTIISRCQVMALRPVADKDIAQALVGRGAEAARAAELARYARGRVGWAIRAHEDPSLLEQRKKWREDAQTLAAASRTAQFAYSEKLAREDVPEIEARLDEWMAFAREQIQAGGDGPLARPAALRELMLARKRLRQNANARLVLDALFLGL